MVLGHDISKGQRTQDVHIYQDVSFDTMLLKSETLKGLTKSGFLKPSPIQLHGIPLGKCGFDLLLEAKSGTGKTAVFTVISLEKLDLKVGVQALILAPTREIAAQVSDVISDIGYYYKGLNVAVVMGGTPFKDDIAKFKENVHIVVGSPGRVRHLITEKFIDLSSVRLLVLDEADKLMESSFLPDINFIFSLLPKVKQVIMSSATYPEETRTFVKKYVRNAQHVCPNTHSVLLGIEQKVINVPHHTNIVKQTQHRYSVLKKILTEKQFKQCLIFCNYQARVGELHRMLSRDKWPAEQLYGQQEQTDRLDALKTLQEYKCRLLISTDLAARGIDAANVDLVVNFETPYDWQTYLHRIGRAGRYGSYGTAITILSEGKETKKFRESLNETNMPFHIRDFWTNDTFPLMMTENSDKESVGAPNIKPYNEHALWDVLISDSSKQKQGKKEEIVSFEGLFNSFKMSTKSNIESFSDLMHSFSVDKDKVNKQITSEYRHVNALKLTIDQEQLKSLGGHKKVKNNVHLDKTENQNVTEENSEAEDKSADVEKTHSSETKHEENRSSEDSLSYKSEKENHVDLGRNDMKKYDKQNQNIRKESEEKELERALIDAGLPTSFGKNKSKPRKVNIYNYNNQSHDSNNNKNTYWEKPKGQQKQKRINRTDLGNKLFDQSDTDEELDEQEYCTHMNNYRKESLIKSKNDLKQKLDPQCYQNNLRKYSESQMKNRSKEFDIWYSNLRRQSKYIQYALYFEELRKL